MVWGSGVLFIYELVRWFCLFFTYGMGVKLRLTPNSLMLNVCHMTVKLTSISTIHYMSRIYLS